MRSRLASWLVRATLTLAALVALLVATAWAVLSLPQFGAPMAGARLARAQANPQYRGGRFVNLEPEAPSTTSLIEYTVQQFSGNEVREPPAPVPVLAVDKGALQASPPARGLRAFWMGHASTYVEIDGLRLLLDPVFAERVSPLPVGPRRFHAPPIALGDLPRIDAVLISHDHYDHLDMDTVRQLGQRGSRFFVPLGIGAHLERWGVPPAQIEELEWWQERSLGPVRIVCTPTRHYSGRGLNNRSTTLWSSWSVIGPQHRFFYSGDTGYGRLFQDIGARLGPFDMAFIKIGAYGPGAAWVDIHMTPEQAVQVHRDLRARRMFPVHWSTFNLA
jgi:L-ascorbate metabolism protein UlaG (beta-lactamase superfamily)